MLALVSTGIRCHLDLSHDTNEMSFCRERSSHRGINCFQNLRRVWLYSVNQEFLEELAEISTIESLFIKGFTATDLTPLWKMKRLRRLILINNPKIQSLDWVAELPAVESLCIEHFQHISHLDPLASLTNLSALGVEGSVGTAMRISSLKPLSNLQKLQFLSLTNLRVSDQKLSHLCLLANLEILHCARYFPDEEFLRLRRALPKLQCQWFDMIDRYGSTSKGVRKLVKDLFPT